MEAKLEGTAEGLTIQDIHSAMKVLDEEVNWPDPLKAAAKLVRAISKEILVRFQYRYKESSLIFSQ